VQYAPKRWLPNVGKEHGQLFTCARPGRSIGATASVPDSVVRDWVASLPSAQDINIVSLLGVRKNGESEFRYYTFRSETEQSQRPKDPTFQDWLNVRFGAGTYTVVEYPTQDYMPIPIEMLEKIASTVREFLGRAETVVLVDSGGDTRVGRVCKHIGFRKSARTQPIRKSQNV